MFRSLVRGAWDLGRIGAASVLESVSKRVVRRLLGSEYLPSLHPEPSGDVVQMVSDQELFDIARKRSVMQAVPRARPEEDAPPNEPPVGSLEWRARQASPSRPG